MYFIGYIANTGISFPENAGRIELGTEYSGKLTKRLREQMALTGSNFVEPLSQFPLASRDQVSAFEEHIRSFKPQGNTSALIRPMYNAHGTCRFAGVYEIEMDAISGFDFDLPREMYVPKIHDFAKVPGIDTLKNLFFHDGDLEHIVLE